MLLIFESNFVSLQYVLLRKNVMLPVHIFHMRHKKGLFPVVGCSHLAENLRILFLLHSLKKKSIKKGVKLY